MPQNNVMPHDIPHNITGRPAGGPGAFLHRKKQKSRTLREHSYALLCTLENGGAHCSLFFSVLLLQQ